jgi:hypothetical protein
MEKSKSVNAESIRTHSWVRQNLIDVAPLWAQFLQTAFANVRIGANERSPTIALTPLKPSRRIDAILMLDPDDPTISSGGPEPHDSGRPSPP